MIQWSDDYRLGINAIDEQHKHLFEIANRAYQLLMNDLRLDKYDAILAILAELRDYTVVHFQDEEKYMASIRFPKLLSHKVQHDDFVEKISNVELRAMDDNQDGFLLDILDFVTNWLVNHILKTDRMYASK